MNSKIFSETSDFLVNYIDKNLMITSPVEHYHGAYEIVFYEKADIVIFVKDKQYNIGDGDLLFIVNFSSFSYSMSSRKIEPSRNAMISA